MSKVDKQTVLSEHPDGRPHVAVDEDGGLHHYAGPCPLTRALAACRSLAQSEAPPKAAGAGPAQVATSGYRSGWDATFGPKRGQA